MEFIAYQNIRRLRQNHLASFVKGDRIVIEEKVDGANFSIRYDEDTDSIKSFSASQELTSANTLRGAYNWAQKLDKDGIKKVLGTRYIAYGEWVVPHTVLYAEDVQNDVRFYDIFDNETGKWLGIDEATQMVEDMGLKFVPILYDGPFISWDEVYKFVGKTVLGGHTSEGEETGEGVVVKNMTKLNNPNSRYPCYVKIVCDRFCEVHKTKKQNTSEIKRREELQCEIASVVTPARVEKLVHKMVDNGILPENWGEESKGIIYKNITGLIYHDCMKEESEVVNKAGKLFGPIANTICRLHVDELIASR